MDGVKHGVIIFSKITNNEDLENLSKELWKLNQYDKNEKDRVLLYVNLSAMV